MVLCKPGNNPTANATEGDYTQLSSAKWHVEGCPLRRVLQQGLRRSSAQNRGLGGGVRLKSGEPTAVPTAAAAAVALDRKKPTEKSAAEPRYMTFEAQNPEPFTIRDYALLRLEHVDAPQLVAAIVTC